MLVGVLYLNLSLLHSALADQRQRGCITTAIGRAGRTTPLLKALRIHLQIAIDIPRASDSSAVVRWETTRGVATESIQLMGRLRRWRGRLGRRTTHALIISSECRNPFLFPSHPQKTRS